MRKNVSYDILDWIQNCSLDQYPDNGIRVYVGTSIYNDLVYHANESPVVYRMVNGVMTICDYPVGIRPDYEQDVAKIVYGKNPDDPDNVIASQRFANRQLLIEDFNSVL